jgi:hypothetical protein
MASMPQARLESMALAFWWANTKVPIHRPGAAPRQLGNSRFVLLDGLMDSL